MTYFPQAAGAADDIARFGLLDQYILEGAQSRIVHVLIPMALKCRQLDENSLHAYI